MFLKNRGHVSEKRGNRGMRGFRKKRYLWNEKEQDCGVTHSTLIRKQPGGRVGVQSGPWATIPARCLSRLGLRPAIRHHLPSYASNGAGIAP